jgi:DNA-directed RNA polymerase specialized sigma24 family protein
MSEMGSVTIWLNRLQRGDREVVQALWERYFRRLVGLARHRLQGMPGAVADEEAVALSAFDSFCRRAEQRQVPDLCDRDDLWQYLLVITARKAGKLMRDQTRDKRDWRRTLADCEEGTLLLGLISEEPDPAVAIETADQLRHLLSLLGNDRLRQIALSKMDGYTNVEIASQLDVALSSVHRGLKTIRTCWSEQLEG